jgi:hypothetical protein
MLVPWAACRQTKDEFSILAIGPQHFTPETLFAKNSVACNYGVYTTCKVLNSGTSPAAIKGLVVTVYLGILRMLEWIFYTQTR